MAGLRLGHGSNVHSSVRCSCIRELICSVEVYGNFIADFHQLIYHCKCSFVESCRPAAYQWRLCAQRISSQEKDRRLVTSLHCCGDPILDFCVKVGTCAWPRIISPPEPGGVACVATLSGVPDTSYDFQVYLKRKVVIVRFSCKWIR